MPYVLFQAAVVAFTVKLATGCGGYLIGSGNITSPNYPNVYPMNSRCSWTLAANPGHYISLRFIHLDIGYPNDYIGVSTEATTGETGQCRDGNRFSGSIDKYGDITKTLLVGPNTTVTFVSDFSAPGFQMEYTSVNISLSIFTDCGGHLVGSGNITSPNYPSFYPMNSRCTWTLAANPGKHMSLRLLDIDTEAGYDYMYIFNGTATSLHSPGCELMRHCSGPNYYCHRSWSTKAFVIGPTVTVVFFSDNSISSSGFKLEYSSVDAAIYKDCGGYLVGSGSITSPNYPNSYPANSRCTWTISPSAGLSLSLRVTYLDIEESFDYVYIFNGSAPKIVYQNNYYTSEGWTGSYIYGTFDMKPKVVVPNSTVVFFSDISGSASGFKIAYESFNATPFTECGGYLVGSGNVTSPNYPSFYPGNSRCVWTISARAGYFLLLHIIYFDTEASFDYVYIYNESLLLTPDRRSYHSGRHSRDYFGRLKPRVFVPNVTVVFFSDSFISASGFQIEYETINAKPSTDCGGYLVGSGYISSPNYPNFYPSNRRCSWTLSASHGFSIALRLISIDTEHSYDYICIFNGSVPTESCGNYKYTGRYSRYYLPSPFVLVPNVTVVFVSDSSISATGFQIQYATINASTFTGTIIEPTVAPCGGDVYGSGVILSPNYPLPYPNNVFCKWNLHSYPAGSTLIVEFPEFDTEENHDVVSIYSEEGTLQQYSGASLPQKIIIGSRGQIVFTSDNSTSTTGFYVTYNSTGNSSSSITQHSRCFLVALSRVLFTVLLVSVQIFLY